jgi:hypothetical protein
MLNKALLPVILLAGIIMLAPSSVYAQWPDDPDSNMIICDHSGEQAIPLIGPTSDGGCYVCWYDNATGNYDMYLQRLDGNGEVQWDQNGMLVSDNPQDTWLTMYDMTVDQNDNAIIVFNDIRNGGDWDIYAYKISPQGAFLWGDDGLTISDNAAFEVIPVVTVTTNNNVVVAWLEEDIIHLRKLTPDGQDYWSDPNVIDMTTTYGMNQPQLCPADYDAVIVQAMVKSGPNYWDPYDVHMYKFSEHGDTTWGGDGTVVTNAGGLAFHMIPYLVPDNYGGAISYWYDSRVYNEMHVYAQHINGDGEAVWEANGVRMCLTAGQFQMNPSLAFFPASENVMVFYKTSNPNQTQFGIGGQLLSAMGQRLWGDDGATILPLADQGRDFPEPFVFENDAILIFCDTPVGEVVNTSLEAARIDVNGGQVWGESPLTISSPVAAKVHLASTMTTNDQVVAVWEDDRYGPKDIYLQNVNPDGTMGPYVTSIDDNDNVPSEITLLKAYPNPFNASTTVSYNLASSGYARVDIFDIMGRLVATLVDGHQTAGPHQVVWDASRVASGTYFARLRVDSKTQSEKLVLLK